MPKLDLSNAPVKTGSIYPSPYDQQVTGRSSKRLGELGGITQYGVNLVRLEPGANASMRHWHEKEDELLIVTEGTLVLVDDTGQHPMIVGDCAAFPAGDPNGHRMENHSDTAASFLVVGTDHPTEVAHYPDENLKVTRSASGHHFTREDGSDL